MNKKRLSERIKELNDDPLFYQAILDLTDGDDEVAGFIVRTIEDDLDMMEE